MNDGALVGPETIDGMTEASATRKPRRPWTRSSLHRRHLRRHRFSQCPQPVRASPIRSCRLLALGPGITSVCGRHGILMTASSHLDACAGRTLRFAARAKVLEGDIEHRDDEQPDCARRDHPGKNGVPTSWPRIAPVCPAAATSWSCVHHRWAQPDAQKLVLLPMRKTTDLRAVCGTTARTVRRAGRGQPRLLSEKTAPTRSDRHPLNSVRSC
jgi:hypothetical protein